MFSTLISIALVAVPALRVAAFDVGSPKFNQCGTAQLTWDATKAGGPYNVVIVSSDDPCGDILADLGDHSGTSMKWNVTFPAGTKLMVSIEDSDEEEGWSGAITVEKSDDASCLNNAIEVEGVSSVPVATTPTGPVQAAGAAVTSTDSTTEDDTPAGALGATSGSSVLRMNPVMALGALVAAALML
ncbi:hypothetical protein MKEN_00347300 [Mycena kentingensis (nom. inval.)]|nr:hypothetical protein MKEN_00347300 [Mycena kentingensis (nom. inval.)]